MDTPILPRMPTPSGRLTRWLWLGGGLVGATGLFLLWRFEPEGQFFFPRCFLHAATGLECPGCGGLRATHALLHGDIAAAWRLNPMLLLGLPLVAWSVAAVAAARRGWRWPNPLAHPAGVALAVSAALLFGVLRNLPPVRQWLGG